MEFEWDSWKRLINLNKHGLDFSDAIHIFRGFMLVKPDTRQNYGEDRFLAFGSLEGRVVVTVYTRRGNSIRIISMRKANEHEAKIYKNRLESIRFNSRRTN